MIAGEKFLPNEAEKIELDTARLSCFQRDLIDLIGVDDAISLMGSFGGRTVYVPRKSKPQDKLSKAISRAAAVRLARRYGGNTVCVPKVDAIKRQIRNHRIRRLNAEGKSNAELSELFSLTTRCIQNICKDQTSATEP